MRAATEPAATTRAIGDDPERADLTSGLGDGDRDGVGVHVKPDESCILLQGDRLLSHVVLRYGWLTDRSVTYGLRL